jgi:hypothetical protein
MQLIARKVKGLESTQLEIVTLAFTACALLSCLRKFMKQHGHPMHDILDTEKDWEAANLILTGQYQQ